jgi:serine/threonine protein kinase/Flp pilus assembly protein TadD
MASRWRTGESPLAEEFLSRHPELWNQPNDALRLIYEEICLRQERGQDQASLEVTQRFPQWQQRLEDILCHPVGAMLSPPGRPGAVGAQAGGGESMPPPPGCVFPEAGDFLGGFRLLAELGHGIRGRVFLAAQPALADRPVVLKITPCDGREHLSLARLQHTHIMPLYWVEDHPHRNLRVLCMPYFGGAALSQLLQKLEGKSLDRLTGQDLLGALDQFQTPPSSPAWGEGRAVAAESPIRLFMAQASYVQAICWIASCLADALHYAHERGLMHLDLKPSNVLLAADGQPMLLDFHLAQKPLHPDGPAPEWLGGTPAYMSPEQKAAFAAMRERSPVSVAVDGRSDIYSLGVILYEALGGSPQALLPPSTLKIGRRLGGTGVTPVDRRDAYPTKRAGGPLPIANPQVTPGLKDLIAKCLRLDAKERYASAAALATDLRRYLSDLPLQGVPNRNLRERWRKWRRRRPNALRLWGLALAFLVASLAAGATWLGQQRHRYGEGMVALQAGRNQTARGHYDEAVEVLQRGLTLTQGLPFSAGLRQELMAELQMAKEKQAAQDFHNLADRIRLRFSADSLEIQGLRDLEASCRTAWLARDRLLDRLKNLSLEEQQRLQTDMLDLAILGANLRVQLGRANDQREAQKAALGVLEEVEALFGPSPVLLRERQLYAKALGLPELERKSAEGAAKICPPTAWEHYSLGRSFLLSGELKLAAAEFQEATNLEPAGLWPNYYKGLGAFRLKHYQDAQDAFSVCIGAASRVATEPVVAKFFYDRALANAEAGNSKEAMKDYGHALTLDPTLGVAAFNRATLQFKETRYSEAIVDLKGALKNGVDPAAVHFHLALVYEAQKDRESALKNLRQALQDEPGHKEARQLLDRLKRQ